MGITKGRSPRTEVIVQQARILETLTVQGRISGEKQALRGKGGERSHWNQGGGGQELGVREFTTDKRRRSNPLLHKQRGGEGRSEKPGGDNGRELFSQRVAIQRGMNAALHRKRCWPRWAYKQPWGYPRVKGAIGEEKMSEKKE